MRVKLLIDGLRLRFFSADVLLLAVLLRDVMVAGYSSLPGATMFQHDGILQLLRKPFWLPT